MTVKHDVSTLLKIVDEINVVRLHSRSEIEWIDRHFFLKSIKTEAIVEVLSDVEMLTKKAMSLLMNAVSMALDQS